MLKRTLAYIFLIAVLLCSNMTSQILAGTMHRAQPVEIPPHGSFSSKVILLPLDSRPPCTQFVEQLASLANTEVTIPPAALLDNYQIPADKKQLRVWLRNAVKGADTAIISADMLIHGGLLSSRLSNGSDEDIAATINLLSTLHRENPTLKIYVFSIIPRLLIADNSDNVRFQKDMLDYSVLKDQVATFENPLDIAKLSQLEQKIPENVINLYTNLYKRSTHVNLALIRLVEQNVLSGLVLGQDDGQPFGLPNLCKQQLQHYIDVHSAVSGKVFITRGTDEVALTLLGRIAMNSQRPKVYVEYSHEQAAQIVMPFMPHTVAKTIQEKLELINAITVDNPDDADFILYVHIGTHNFKERQLLPAVRKVSNYLDQGYKVALVDLTEDFYANETLLPILVHENANIIRLAAYAGWNTTSNSIGTAVTQAAIFTTQLHQTPPSTDRLLLYKNNLEFLSERFLDDFYYQKDVQPTVNKYLREQHIDPYHLQDHYAKTNELIANLLRNRSRDLYAASFSNHPINIDTGQGIERYAVSSLTLQSRLPWERTFEVQLIPQLTMVRLLP